MTQLFSRTPHVPERYQRYIDLIVEPDIFQAYRDQLNSTQIFLQSLSEGDSQRRYREEKWSVKQVIGHLIDVERIFSLRLIRFSRGDVAHRDDWGFDKSHYVTAYSERFFDSVTQEFLLLRQANICAFGSLREDQGAIVGESYQDKMDVWGLMYVLLGHERHHLNMIRDVYIS
ncbi:MAG: DinB family protein [Deinococcaceae bacterium]